MLTTMLRAKLPDYLLGASGLMLEPYNCLAKPIVESDLHNVSIRIALSVYTSTSFRFCLQLKVKSDYCATSRELRMTAVRPIPKSDLLPEEISLDRFSEGTQSMPYRNPVFS